MSIHSIYGFVAFLAFACGIVAHDARGDDLASTSGGSCGTPNSSCTREGDTCRSSYYECCEGFENEFKGYLYSCTCRDSSWLCLVNDPACVFVGCGLPRATSTPTHPPVPTATGTPFPVTPTHTFPPVPTVTHTPFPGTPTPDQSAPFGRAEAAPNPARSGVIVRLFASDVSGEIGEVQWEQVGGSPTVDLDADTDPYAAQFVAPEVDSATVLTFELRLIAPASTHAHSSLISVTIEKRAIPCTGDCDGDGKVAVHELIRGVRISLGLAAVQTCSSLVAEAEREAPVSINQIVAAIGFALRGCSMENQGV